VPTVMDHGLLSRPEGSPSATFRGRIRSDFQSPPASHRCHRTGKRELNFAPRWFESFRIRFRNLPTGNRPEMGLTDARIPSIYVSVPSESLAIGDVGGGGLGLSGGGNGLTAHVAAERIPHRCKYRVMQSVGSISLIVDHVSEMWHEFWINPAIHCGVR